MPVKSTENVRFINTGVIMNVFEQDPNIKQTIQNCCKYSWSRKLSLVQPSSPHALLFIQINLQHNTWFWTTNCSLVECQFYRSWSWYLTKAIYEENCSSNLTSFIKKMVPFTWLIKMADNLPTSFYIIFCCCKETKQFWEVTDEQQKLAQVGKFMIIRLGTGRRCDGM